MDFDMAADENDSFPREPQEPDGSPECRDHAAGENPSDGRGPLPDGFNDHFPDDASDASQDRDHP